jgi:hypothetical protein
MGYVDFTQNICSLRLMLEKEFISSLCFSQIN